MDNKTLNNQKTTALAIAEFFIDKANREKKILTNKKLQKLLYYAQAWSLVLKNQTLFDEKIEAWVHGPAIKSVYIKFKSFGFNSINKEPDEISLSKLSKDTKQLLESIWTVYGNLDGDYLELLTHSEKPWQEAREGLQSSENSENEISLITMKSYYSQKLEESKKD